MIAEDLQPISIVENSGFQSMVKLLDSRYEIPSRRVLSRSIIPEIFTQVKNKVQRWLTHTKYISITTDIWTSMNTDSFITMTAHFFTGGETELKTVVLCTKKLLNDHTEAYLSEVMINELTNWDILNKVVAIVTDGGANIKLAVRNMNIPHVPCIAHKLNLIVQQALLLSNCTVSEQYLNEADELKNILKKCRNIVAYFKRSEKGNRLLECKQKQFCITQVLKLKQDVKTRWNSTLLMLERLVLLKEPLTLAMISLEDAPISLTQDEWIVVEDIIPLLKPYNNLTIELSAELFPTISKVIPLIRGLQNALSLKSPKTAVGHFIKTNLRDNTTRRLDGIEKQMVTPSFSRATFLDPRLKKQAFGLEENASEAEKAIVFELADLLKVIPIGEQATDCIETNQDNDNLWSFFKSKITDNHSQVTSTSNAQCLLNQYISMPNEDLKSNVAEFWYNHKSVFHSLSDLGLKYACIPATSVPSERIFSKAGQILCARRNRLLPKNLDTLIFLNKNM